MAHHEHEHDQRRPDIGRQVQRPPENAAQHPLLDLQQQAGNTAVAQLMALQRHSLDPEEEAG